MVHFDYVIKNSVGLHARPAKAITEYVRNSNQEVSFIYKEKKADARSILSLVCLGAVSGEQITIEINGNNEAFKNELEILLNNVL